MAPQKSSFLHRFGGLLFGTTRARVITISIVAGLLAIIVPRLLAPQVKVATKPLSPVILATPRQGILEESFTFSGHLKPESSTTVVPKVGGKVLEILVKEGQTVREGQLLVRLEEDVGRLQVEQAQAAFNAASAQFQKADTGVRPEELESAKASLRQAEEDVRIAKANLERSQRLFEAGTLARSKFEDAQNQVKSAETQVENAKRQVQLMEQGARAEDKAMARAQADASGKQLELARLQLGYSRVTAPISGTIAKVHTQRGQFAGPGTPLVSIINDSTIFAVVSVPELHYGAFYRQEKDYTVAVRPISYSSLPPFEGRITSVSEIIDAASRNFEMEIAVNNQQGLLKPGMYVSASTTRPKGEPGLLLPRRAVLLREGKNVVFVAAPDSKSVVMREVRTGRQNDRDIQILEGLEPDNLVVVEGNTFLESMQEVQVVQAP